MSQNTSHHNHESGDDPALNDLSRLGQPLLSPASGLCGGPGQLSCEEASEMIQMVLDHLADGDGEQKFLEHVGDCPPCESEFFVYQRIVESLVRTRPQIPEDAATRLNSYCDELRAQRQDPTAL